MRIFDREVVGSRQVNVSLEQYWGNGMSVVVYGAEADELGRRPTEATRMEISLEGVGQVVVHKDYDPGRGLFGAVARVDEIEVMPLQGQAETLRVTVDPTTSPYNPLCVFSDEGGNKGWV